MLPSSAAGIIPSMQAIQAETTAMCARTPLSVIMRGSHLFGKCACATGRCECWVYAYWAAAAAATNRSTLKIRVSEFRYDRHWLGYLPAFPSSPSLSSPLTPEKKLLTFFRILVKLRTDDPGKGGFDGIFQLLNTCIFAVVRKPWASSRPITSARDERVGEDPVKAVPSN